MSPRTQSLPASLTLVAAAAIWFAACAAPAPAGAQVELAADHAAAAHPPASMPPLDAQAAVHLPGLHNVVTYGDGLCGGSVPVGDDGFASLAAMGVRTIVSVDGATPAVELAHRHGLRYIHLPISYDGVAPERALELAQVIANAEGPIYMHCHHGKHRSAAALAAGGITAGRMTAATAQARMKVSGTSPNYPGLWEAARTATPAAPQQLHADVAAFPEIAQVSGLVGLMAEADVVFDLVKAAQQSGWQVPADHPDLVPQKETRRLVDLFRALRTDTESMALPQDYQQQLDAFTDAADALDRAVRAGRLADADATFAALGKSCKSCHTTYRDQ
ncbi:MAG: cytochrome c [Planctomycetota bacterium]